jgi:hypothetical protein
VGRFAHIELIVGDRVRKCVEIQTEGCGMKTFNAAKFLVISGVVGICLLWSTGAAHAATIALWDYSAGTAVPSSVDANVTAATAIFTGFPGFFGGLYDNTGVAVPTEATALALNIATHITVTANAGFVLNLTSLDLWLQGGTTPSYWVYATAGVPLAGTSIGNGNGTALGTFAPFPTAPEVSPITDPSNDGSKYTVDLSGPAYQGLSSIDLQIFINPSADSFYNFLGGEQLNGTADLSPEPASVVLLGLGGLLMLARGRSRP